VLNYSSEETNFKQGKNQTQKRKSLMINRRSNCKGRNIFVSQFPRLRAGQSELIESVGEVEVEVNLRSTVGRRVCLGVRRPSGTRDQFFFLLENFFRQLRVCYFVAPSLTRGRVCNLLYNCFWALLEQSLLGPSPAELTTIFYCLI
jgi:hypothetical protein